MKKILLFSLIILFSCSSNDNKEYVLGEDDLSLVLNGKIFKYDLPVNYGWSNYLVVIEFSENEKRTIHRFCGAYGVRCDRGECWTTCGGGDSEIKIESPNYIEYVNGNNITLIEGKLYYKNSLTSTYKTTYEMSDSSLKEIEDLKTEIEIKCDGNC